MAVAKVEFDEAALSEILAAESWYAERSPFASRTFEATLDAALLFLAEHPQASPRYLAGTRRKVIQRFPYALIYLIEEERIFVVALAHARRRPGYWRTRLSPR